MYPSSPFWPVSSSWMGSEHDTEDRFQYSMGQQFSYSARELSLLNPALMAAGSPWSWIGNQVGNVTNWVGGAVQNVTGWIGNQIGSVYNWTSDNISALPLGIFSTLAGSSPYAMPGVRYYVPSGLDPDVLAVMSGSQWNKAYVTYAFPDSRYDYEWINPSASGFRPLSFETQQAARHILEGWSPYGGGPGFALTSVEGVTNLELVYAGTNGGDLQISGFTPGSMINRSHGYYPGVPVYSGDTWITRNSDLPGSGSYALAMHELGHALGLKHPHESGGALPRMSAAHDSSEYTVMSYNTFSDDPQTLMQYDIRALQAMYGADFTTNSGATVYRWVPGSGQTFVNGVSQGATSGNHIFLTIWDGGGNDTYDLTAFLSDGYVDLGPGGYVRFSDTQLARKGYGTFAKGNVYNAFLYNGDSRSLIENAYTGRGNDKVIGNDADNRLIGNDGNDTVYGGNGNDALWGGNDNDFVYGGFGNDTIEGGYGSDVMFGESGNDVLVAIGTGNWMTGGTGADIFQLKAPAKSCTITDFETGYDKIHIASSLFANFSAVRAAAYQNGSSVIIAKGDFSLTLHNMNLSKLAAYDFAFI